MEESREERGRIEDMQEEEKFGDYRMDEKRRTKEEEEEGRFKFVI